MISQFSQCFRSYFFSSKIQKRYDPTWTETPNRVQLWNSFIEQIPSETKKTFSMILPPPNVTGQLHLGHALTHSIEDTINRHKFLNNEISHWIPGTDHAGIATQVVVEKKINHETGKSRLDLGRENFIKEIHNWCDTYSKRIRTQTETLGSTLSWKDEFFTLDKPRAKAVSKAFIDLYNLGYIYRKSSFINWSCILQSTISDIEVDSLHVAKPQRIQLPSYSAKDFVDIEPDLSRAVSSETPIFFGMSPNYIPKTRLQHDGKVEFGIVYLFAYPLEGATAPFNQDNSVIVATTRPETLFGDTAIAIHPDNPSTQWLKGKHVIHPFFPDRKLPIIQDSVLVDPEKGTGCVKITPAHDENDFHAAERSNDPNISKKIVVIDIDGTMTESAGATSGMKRYVARNWVISSLKTLGLYVGKQEFPTTLKICSRSGDVIEPFIKDQWFVNTTTSPDNNLPILSEMALNFVKDEKMKITPSGMVNSWNRWLNDSRDWCISRQLWWGHQIPAFKVVSPQKPPEDTSLFPSWPWIVGESESQVLDQLQNSFDPSTSIIIKRDQDVLDTWFSSAILPLSSLGWPDLKDPRLSGYPLNLMETGGDILFFWVARMAMLCPILYNDDSQPPFHSVYLHPIIRDSQGRKMSKSLGNVIDPLDVIYGKSKKSMLEEIDSNHLLSKSERKVSKQNIESEFPQGMKAYGSDVLRLTLLSFLTSGREGAEQTFMNISTSMFDHYYKFMNKIWQAVRFYYHRIEMFDDSLCSFKDQIPIDPLPSDPSSYTHWDLWILHQYHSTLTKVKTQTEQNLFGNASDSIIKFFIDQFCDQYIEMCKRWFHVNPQTKWTTSLNVMYSILLHSMVLFHPYMPFISDTLYSQLRNDPSAMILNNDKIACLPKFESFDMVHISDKFIPLVTQIRASRLSQKIPYSNMIICQLYTPDITFREYLSIPDIKDMFCYSCRLQGIEFVDVIPENEPRYGEFYFKLIDE